MAIINGNSITIESQDNGNTIALADMDYVILDQHMDASFKIRFVRTAESLMPNRITSSLGIRGTTNDLTLKSLILLKNVHDSIELVYDTLNKNYQVVAVRDTSQSNVSQQVSELYRAINNIVDGSILFQIGDTNQSHHHSAVLPVELATALIQSYVGDYQYIVTNMANNHRHYLMVKFNHQLHEFYIADIQNNHAIAHLAWAANSPDNRIVITAVSQDYGITAKDSYRTLLRCGSPNPLTINIPIDDGSIAIGACVLIGKSGLGDITITGDQGVVINTPSTGTIQQIHGKITAMKVGDNEWDLSGHLMEIQV